MNESDFISQEFKRNTSPSTCHQLLKHFSEDFDLIRGWEELGFPTIEP